MSGRLLSFYLAATEALARAYEEDGQPERAIAVLEKASSDRHRRLTYGGGKPEWLEIRRDLARLYRKVGREPEASAVEEEIGRMTVRDRHEGHLRSLF